MSMTDTGELNFTFDATETVKSVKLSNNGFIKFLVFDLPNFTNAITGVVTILDKDGYTLYTSGSLAENAIATAGASIGAAVTGGIPVDYNYTMILTLSGAAGGTGGTAVVKAYIQG